MFECLRRSRHKDCQSTQGELNVYALHFRATQKYRDGLLDLAQVHKPYLINKGYEVVTPQTTDVLN